ncbi:MAG: type II toxin-antitoxin system VapC family toxin [Anaerolineae bacterium]
MEPVVNASAVGADAFDAVVIDANLALALVLPLPYMRRATELYDEWMSLRIPLYVPILWEYEVTSSVRKAVAQSAIDPADAQEALERVLNLSVTRTAPDRDLDVAALMWATRLQHIVAYDAQYLALAERLGAVFWTADRKLAAGARAAGADWVREIRADD